MKNPISKKKEQSLIKNYFNLFYISILRPKIKVYLQETIKYMRILANIHCKTRNDNAQDSQQNKNNTNNSYNNDNKQQTVIPPIQQNSSDL